MATESLTSDVISLSPTRIVGSKPLMQALKDRSSTKTYAAQQVPLEIISDLLWAADGINRPESEKRTAPSATNSQNVDVYVLLTQGAYLYDARSHSLAPVLAEDLRPLSAGPQDYAKDAPLHLLYVADYGRMSRVPEPSKRVLFSACNVGVICQNVGLFCASIGLGTVVRGTMDTLALHGKLKLRDDQEIILNQVVGYPKE
jgi:nitroreductase